MPEYLSEIKGKLVQDLEHIANGLVGPFVLDEAALSWGTKWYAHHNTVKNETLADERFDGYLARKRTHMHKLAMILSASRNDSRVITIEDLATAEKMLF